MKRTIEKLAQDRSEQEARLQNKLLRLRERAEALDRLEHDLLSPPLPPKRKAGGFLSFLRSKPPAEDGKLRDYLSVAVRETRALTLATADLFEHNAVLTDAKDREWDALGSNHVGLIFKSMEWRVDRLAASYDDAQAMMRTFVLLKDQLDRLTATIAEKRLPTPAEVREVAEPLDDGRYTSFENRFRGAEAEIKKQQEAYLSCFRPGSRVLDLGCGRGEFLDLLRTKGIQGVGIDGNGRMIDICLDKGLDCRKGDLLEALADWPDASLDGVFSSQVIEHLRPAALKRMVELAFVKLAPGGVLVLETVNPTSVFALVQIYYLDMTHQHPVHPQALKFLLESSGLDEVEIRFGAELHEERLQSLPGADETSAILNRDIDSLNRLLYGPPNYAVLGKKT